MSLRTTVTRGRGSIAIALASTLAVAGAAFGEPGHDDHARSRSRSRESAQADPDEARSATGAVAERGTPGERSLPTVDASAIANIVGTQADTTADGIVRVSWPRSEVPVVVDGVPFPVAAGLTSWAGFAPAEGGAMVMGDTVVFQDEVDVAMDAALEHGLEITALHNHFFYDDPKVYFMHIGGHGEATALAAGVHAVWEAIRELRDRQPHPASSFRGVAPKQGGQVEASTIERITGVKATVSNGVTKITVAREATMSGTRFGGSMGLTTWAAFTGGDADASIDGDFAMTASEVQPVLRALRDAGLHVVALHNHMIGEEPAIYFAHFWAVGPADDLARGFRAALEAQRSR